MRGEPVIACLTSVDLKVLSFLSGVLMLCGVLIDCCVAELNPLLSGANAQI